MASPTVDRHRFWQRTLRGWDVAFYALVVVVAVSAVGAGSARAVVVGLTSLAVLTLAYTLVGRRAALGGDGRGADLYLVVLVAVTTVGVGVGDFGFVLLFIAYSQIWFFSRDRRAGTAWSVVLSLLVTGAAALRYGLHGPDVLDVGLQMGISLAFSLVIGLWITSMAEQSEERAGLIEQLESAQAALAAEHHGAGVLAERARLAQEIHDTLAQGFTSVVMLAQAATAELDRDATDDVRRRLGQMEQVARDNLAEARALVAAFGPAALEHASLAQALDRLARRFEAETGVRVDLEGSPGPGDVPLGRETEVVLLRAAQEALANVRRHARASHVRIGLAVTDGRADLQVVDDGRGLPPGVADGVGLRGMRERADAGGGHLALDSPPGGGTRVRLVLPVGAASGSATAPSTSTSQETP